MSWSLTRLAVSIPSRISSRLEEPSRISTRSGLPFLYSSTSLASSVPRAEPRFDFASSSRFSLTFCSALIASSSTCALLKASTTSSRFESSSWICAITACASACFDSMDCRDRRARQRQHRQRKEHEDEGVSSVWSDALPPARGNAHSAWAALHKSGMVTGPLDGPQTEGAGRAFEARSAGRLLRSWTRAPEDPGSGSRRLARSRSPPSFAPRRHSPTTRRRCEARPSGCARRTTASPPARRRALLELYALETRLAARRGAGLDACGRAAPRSRATSRPPGRGSRWRGPTSPRPSAAWATACASSTSRARSTRSR